MILNTLIMVLAFACSFTSTIFADTGRANHLIAQTGGAGGIAGIPGLPGLPGLLGTNAVSGFSDFYALMPPDNAATVAPGSPVAFPEGGPTSGSIIRDPSDPTSSFILPAVGTYLVEFQVSVSEAGQLGLSLNGALLAYTVVGRATGTSQIVGVYLVTTTAADSILEVINPPGETTALTITPYAGGVDPVSAHLVIIRLQ